VQRRRTVQPANTKPRLVMSKALTATRTAA
jgi:hypothetical protein